jgi:hypothetical protein
MKREVPERISLSRQEAINILVAHELVRLAPTEREDLLLDWWNWDSDDPGFAELPASLQHEVLESTSPKNASAREYDPLLMMGLRHRFYGVRNEYLKSELRSHGIRVDELIGLPERMSLCPCCQYHSLESRGRYDVCPVCMWEDDGTAVISQYSQPNHMTLGEAQSNFRRKGACDPNLLHKIQPTARAKYTRGRN